MKYAFMKSHRVEFSVSAMTRVLVVSRSGYYAWLKRPESQQAKSNRQLEGKIKALYQQHKRRYGSPRITKALQAEGEQCSENRVAKRMQSLDLKAIQGRKFKQTTNSKHSGTIADNLLQQDFTAQQPDQVWVSDITYLWTNEGWYYLATVMDVYSRFIVGWAMDKTMTCQLVCDALSMAQWRRGFPKHVIVHSDRGSQYGSKQYQGLLHDHQLICSMSGRGNCYDNAAMESFYHSLKVEEIYCNSYRSREQTRLQVFEYIESYYNTIRLHSTNGYLSPRQFEEVYNSLK